MMKEQKCGSGSGELFLPTELSTGMHSALVTLGELTA